MPPGSPSTEICTTGSSTSSSNSLVIAPYNASSPLTCAPPTLSFSAPGYCGYGAYNLTSFAYGPDLNFTRSNGEVIYVRLCGAVSQPNCVANFGNNVQICQWESPTSQNIISILNAPSGETTFSYANGLDVTGGISFLINDGAQCNINNVIYDRRAIGTIVCGAINNITQYYETSTACVYSFTISSPLVCPQQFQFCYTTYSTSIENGNTQPAIWTSITSGIFSAGISSTYVYQVGQVSGTRNLSYADGTNRIMSSVALTIVEPTTTCLGPCNNIIFYMPGSANASLLGVGGITFDLASSQTDPIGSCSGNQINIAGATYSCSSGSQTNQLNTLVIVPYNGVSTLTCTPPVNNVIPQGYCGIGPYNFSALAAGPDISAYFSTYTIYMRLCGAVSQPDCVRSFGHNSQVCQWTPGYQFEVATLNNPTGQIFFNYTNGVDGTAGISFTIVDGAFCAANLPRQVYGQITCGPLVNMTNFYENGTCHYYMFLTAPQACTASSGIVAAPITSSQFAFCHITYTSFTEDINNSNYNNWAAVEFGTFTTVSTSVANVFSVVGVTGTRNVAATDGTGHIVSTASIIRLETPGACFGGCDNNLIFPSNFGGGTAYYFDAGVTFDLSVSQSDGAGCRGSSILLTEILRAEKSVSLEVIRTVATQSSFNRSVRRRR